MEQWQDAASQQVKLLTNRVNELLAKGQLWLRSELGVDLGLKPELIPPWVILVAACFGLVLMIALWASACRALFRKHPAAQTVEDSTEVKRGGKPAKPEEQKKKKKKAEKKSQPNGRAVVEPQEEAIVTEEIVPHHHPPTPEVKTEKAAEVKKSKKKAKQAAKEMAKTVTTDGKEPEEGTWETKVSNKEKREQRKKDKGSSDGSASPGGGNTPVTTAEQPKASPAPPPANQKKKKGGDTIKVKTEKVEPVVPKVSQKNEPAVAVTVAEVKKVPVQTVAPKIAHWATNRDQPASLWGSEIDGSWTVIDRNMQTSDLKLGSYTALGGSAGEPQSVRERPWLKQPAVDDEWSGINGGSVDCNSDWNAPSEVWGNYEEPAPEPAPVEQPSVPEPAKTNLLIGAVDDDDEKDKEDISTDGAGKTKRKKKKKKKAAEEGATTGQGEEPEKEVALAASVKKQPEPVKAAATEMKVERFMKDSTAQKPPVTQVPQKPTEGEPTAKQNNPPAPLQQKKPEESQVSKPTKKKKPRRET